MYTEIEEQLRNYSFEVQISKYIAYFWKKTTSNYGMSYPNIVIVLQIQFSYTKSHEQLIIWSTNNLQFQI